MEIKLEHNEIVQAIEEYLAKQIQLKPGQDISVELTAGRKDKGHYADIKIGNTAPVGKVDTAEKVVDSNETGKAAAESTNDSADDGLGSGEEQQTTDAANDTSADKGGSLFSD